MHRRPLLDLLDRYEKRHPEERVTVDRIRQLVEAHADCFERTCLPGHVTASAWIVSPDGARFLLTHHRKLGRWLQLGGHTDGDPDVARSALREAREESGMERFRWVLTDGELLPIDLDVHDIPAHGKEPAHEHHDVRFLLVAEPDQTPSGNHESVEVRWFDASRLDEVAREESLHRLGRKAAPLLRHPETRPA
jgi:8-oxo-dGTP pyrophosphatase MutT (NUDIX family)